MESLDGVGCDASGLDEKTLREMLSFALPAESTSTGSFSPLQRRSEDFFDFDSGLDALTESSKGSRTQKTRKKHTKRSRRRAKAHGDKCGFVSAEEEKLTSNESLDMAESGSAQAERRSIDLQDPFDFLNLNSSLFSTLQTCCLKNKRAAVSEIKSRMLAIEESIQQARAVLKTLIVPRQ